MEIESTYLVVERFGVVNLGLGRQDPYKKYPKPFGYLAGEVVATELIETRHVKCHFALTPIEFNNRNLIHVFPMNRVNYSHWWSEIYEDTEVEDERDENEETEETIQDDAAMDTEV
ncbi:hypothetical protein B0H11DRAFT_2221292 [Mycena galericulata]|nr:hypothetical protein B0H11DRAFT_2221292 [Mycena galericulata]